MTSAIGMNPATGASADVDPTAIRHIRVSWLPSWSNGDAEDAAVLELSGRDAPLAATAANPRERSVSVSVTDTRFLGRMKHWSNDRFEASRLSGLQALTDSLSGVLQIGTPVAAGSPLPLGTWRVELAEENPWEPMVLELSSSDARDLGLYAAATELLLKPRD